MRGDYKYEEGEKGGESKYEDGEKGGESKYKGGDTDLHCTMCLSTQLELSKVFKSKGLVFAQF